MVQLNWAVEKNQIQSTTTNAVLARPSFSWVSRTRVGPGTGACSRLRACPAREATRAPGTPVGPYS